MLGIPAILVGGVRGKENIEDILNTTGIEYVSMTRPFVSNPNLMNEWMNK